MRRAVFDDEHEWFRETVRDFANRELTPHREEHREAHSIPREVWLKAGELGMLGVGIPEEHGGNGIDDFRFNAVMDEELSRAGVAYGSAFGIHIDVVAPYLAELTTNEQRERWLPGFTSGKLITALGMTEPEAGSDLAALRTSARRDGDEWVIDGGKTFITNGSVADLAVVAARTGKGHSGISMFAVESDRPGFTRGEPLRKIGQHEASTSE
ncbi:MAG TPA: acyl-CoA dehydrogenase family protein, partial [Gemmatimonadales bacterium]|nr:acyl-CoA dehydrogenase family protein [Gemmatimonadales bacterium]